ncbi:hypothetical protein EDC96DRAFT_511010 [Choanephora cucurbitarum]|nr:hypothetical protein EDC96DRAFT_511010 [Choanephora cucurbitarum]
MSMDDKWEFDMPKFWDFTNSIPQERPNESWFCEKNISGPSFPVQDKPKQTQPTKSSKLSVFDRLARENTVASTSKLNHKQPTDKAQPPRLKKTLSDHTSLFQPRPPHARKRLREGSKPVESIPSTNRDRKEDAHLDSTNKRFKTKPKLIETSNSSTTAGLEQGKIRPRKLLKGTVNSSHSNVVSDEDFSLKCTLSEEERRRLPEITIARATLAREDLRQSIQKTKEKERGIL